MPALFQNRRRWLVGVVLIVVLFLAARLLLGFSINVAPTSAAEQLRQNQARWQERGADSYAMTLHRGMFTYDVFVRQNQVAEVTARSILVPTPSVVPDDELAGYMTLGSLPLLADDPIANYTVNVIFEDAAAQIARQPAPYLLSMCGDDGVDYEIHYDEALGYVTSFVRDNCHSDGLMCGAISECHTEFHVTDLRLLPEE
jgi:hypothetical protein